MSHPHVQQRRRDRPFFFRRISIRILLFNLILVIVPIAGVLFFETFERQLLTAQENSMAQQARLLAAALSGPEADLASRAQSAMTALQQQTETRLRVISAKGELLADSTLEQVTIAPSADAALEPSLEREGSFATSLSRTRFEAQNPALDRAADRAAIERTEAVAAPSENSPPASPNESARDSLLYQIGRIPFDLLRNLLGQPDAVANPADFYARGDFLLGQEIQAALQGRYGSMTRYSVGGQRSVQLYSALPITSPGQDGVIAVVLASQSTYRILRDLYELRVDVFSIFLLSLLIAMAVSLYYILSITRPLRKLTSQARSIVDHRGRLLAPMQGLRSKDEVGLLSQSLSELTRRLKRHLDLIEGFASEVSHELRNPLASIRSTVELLQTQVPEHAQKLQSIMNSVDLLDQRIRYTRDLSRLDTALEAEQIQTVDTLTLCSSWANDKNLRFNNRFVLGTSARILGRPERLIQVFDNLLDNASGFCKLEDIELGLSDHPPLETLRAEAATALGSGQATLWIWLRDRGPGFPPGHIERVFARFFSWRPQQAPEHHASANLGLGLAVCKTIVEGYGGCIFARNHPEGGALLAMAFPGL